MSFIERIKKDYFMKNRYSEYNAFLERALAQGYSFVKLCDFGDCIFSNDSPITILRHDIDTDIAIAKKMFAIEKSLNIKSTYYFRRSTINKKFIKELLTYGCEVGYHFEETSDFAYRHNLSNPDSIKKHYPEIRAKFIKNKTNMEKMIGKEIITVASHGDFVNRKTGIINNEFLNKETRDTTRIKYEAYDDILMSQAKYCSDGANDFMDKLSFNDSNFYYILVHPRTWDSAFFVRAAVDLQRLFKGVKYKVFSKINRVLEIIKEILSLPKTKLTFVGEENYSTYKYFTKPHPKYIIFKNKTLGVCLLERPKSFEQYLTGKERQVLRTKRNKSIKNGYTFAPLDVAKFVDDIIEINTSKGERQGHEMNRDYFDKEKVVSVAKNMDCFGVFNHDGKVVSYCYLINAGDFVVISRLLGHADYLNDGVMHFMISECVNMWVNGQKWTNADYFLYDTWFGAMKGLKIFKTDLGFRPYRAKYKFIKERK